VTANEANLLQHKTQEAKHAAQSSSQFTEKRAGRCSSERPARSHGRIVHGNSRWRTLHGALEVVSDTVQTTMVDPQDTLALYTRQVEELNHSPRKLPRSDCRLRGFIGNWAIFKILSVASIA
jgi:hypothetical protein